MGVLDVLELVGLTLAFVDFFRLAGRLEKRVDRLRDALDRLLTEESALFSIMGRMVNIHTFLEIKPFNWMLSIGMGGFVISLMGHAIGDWVFDSFEGSLLREILLYVSGLFLVVGGLAVLIGLAARPFVLLLLVLIPAVRGVLHVLDMPRAGTIGTVALLVAIGSFVWQRI